MSAAHLSFSSATVRCVQTAAFLMVTTNGILAADATFSQDGRRVYLIEFFNPKPSAELTAIDVEKQSVSRLDLGSFIGQQQIMAVDMSATADLLLVTKSELWAYDFQKKTCAKLCTAPKDMRFDDLACNPKNGAILLSTRSGEGANIKADALILERGGTTPLELWMRRVEFLRGMAFARDGNLFFGTHGDLWRGLIQKSEPDDPRPYWLEAIRCAPLATFETTYGTPSQMGVFQIAVADSKVYVHLHRIGGSGIGNVVRLDKPADAAIDAEDDLAHRLGLYSKEIASVEILAENGGYSYLCASPDGKHVFFRGAVTSAEEENYGLYLVENNEKPRKLNIELPK